MIFDKHRKRLLQIYLRRNKNRKKKDIKDSPSKALITVIANIDLKRVCYRCGDKIRKGEAYRTYIGGHCIYCAQCIGFFLSRYSLTFLIFDPTEAELKAKDYFDEQIKVLTGITREDMWLESVWTGV